MDNVQKHNNYITIWCIIRRALMSKNWQDCMGP
jgi:hypothetical protein